MTHKPQPKFGWSDEVALQHETDLEQTSERLYGPLILAKLGSEDVEATPWIPDSSWDADAGLLTDETYERPPTIAKRNFGDYRQMLEFTPQESEWVKRAMVELEAHPDVHCAIPTCFGRSHPNAINVD